MHKKENIAKDLFMGIEIIKPVKSFLRQILEKLFIFFGTALVLVPMSPLNVQYAERDAGVFLYIGWRILNGELPYRDVWDHKPPVVFYLNAFGLAIGDGTRWGVWLLEFLSLFLAAFLGYKIIQKMFGSSPAILSTVLWLLTLVITIQGGGKTTEYILPMQFMAIWLAKGAFDGPDHSNWRWFLTGFIGAVAFFTKQTSVGVWLSVLVFLIIYRLKSHQIKKLISEILYFSGGFIAVCIFWIVFFGLQGGFAEFWDSAFKYNFYYSFSDRSVLSRLQPAIAGIHWLTGTGLFQIAGIGYLLGLLLLLFKRNSIHYGFPLMAIALIDLPVELILISASGKMYQHYYMTILPVLSFFAGVTFWTVLSSRVAHEIPPVYKKLLLAGILGMLLWGSVYHWQNQEDAWKSTNQFHSLVADIVLNTSPDDRILLWGAESTVNFYSHRKSPTRYVYLYPLYKSGYTSEQKIVDFLDEVIQTPPRWIIDTHNEETPFYDFPIETEAIQSRILRLQKYYEIKQEIIFGDWTFYEYKGNY